MGKTKVTQTINVDSGNTLQFNVLLLNDNLLLDSYKNFVFHNNKSFGNVKLNDDGTLTIPLDLPEEITTILVVGASKTQFPLCKVNSQELNDSFKCDGNTTELFTLTKEKNDDKSEWFYTMLNIKSEKSVHEIVGMYYHGIIIK